MDAPPAAFVIDWVNADDLPGVVALLARANGETVDPAALARRCKGGHHLVSRHQGRVVGYLAWAYFGSVSDLRTLALDPELNGSTLGTELIEYYWIEALSASCEVFLAEVTAWPAPAREALQAHGYHALTADGATAHPVLTWYLDVRLPEGLAGHELLVRGPGALKQPHPAGTRAEDNGAAPA